MVGLAAQTAPRARGSRRMTIAAVALGLLTAVLIVSYVSRRTQEQRALNTASMPVVLATHDIPASATITADMVSVKLVTPDLAAKTALTQTKQAIGQHARYAVPTGAQLLPGMLIQPGSSDALSLVVPAGKRAVAVATTDVINGGNHIRPGDFVDVMAVFDASKLINPASTATSGQNLQGVYTILQNIQVLAVADVAAKTADSGPQTKNSAGDNTPDLGKNGSVTIAADPYESQLLFLAETEGKIRLALRSYGDGEVKPVAAVLEPLGASGGAPQPR
jgi:Flp pilus assembly protein CpaB